MNTSARFYLSYNSRNMLKTQESSVFVDSILYKKRTFLTFMLSKHDVITHMTSNNDYGVIYIMTFCNCSVTVTRLICMFITRVLYYIYLWHYYMENGLCYTCRTNIYIFIIILLFVVYIFTQNAIFFHNIMPWVCIPVPLQI